MGCKLLQGEAELGVMRTGLKQTTRRLHHRERGVGRLQGSRWRDRRKKKKFVDSRWRGMKRALERTLRIILSR
jgi:hypothetical protein